MSRSLALPIDYQQKTSSTIDWVRFNDSCVTIGCDDNYRLVNSSRIVFNNFQPSLAFVPTFAQKKQKTVYFLEQTIDSSNRNYIRRHRYYSFDSTSDGLEGEDVTEQIESRDTPLLQKAIDQIPSDMNLIAAFGQYSYYDNRTIGDGYGLILIFDTPTALKYCYTSSRSLSPDVRPAPIEFQLLIKQQG